MEGIIMKTVKPFLSGILGTMILIGFLAGCTAPEPEIIEVRSTVVVEKLVEVPKEVEVETKVNQTVVVSSRIWNTPNEQAFLINEIVKPFERETGYVVNFQVLTDDELLRQAQVQQETGHVTTDLVIAFHQQMADWIDAGLVQDLTDLAAGWTDRTFTTSFAADTNREGLQYFIPVNADVYVLLVNRKALAYLPEGTDVQSLSWETFAQWAVAIAQGEGVGKTVVSGAPRKNWIYQFGSTALSYGAGFPEIDSEAAREAWNIWAQIGTTDGFIPDVKRTDNVVDSMQREEAWLTLLHCSQVAEALRLKERQFLVVPAPSGPSGIGSVAGISGLALMEDAPNQAGAEAFLEYLSRPDIQVKISKGTNGLIPSVLEAANIAGDDVQGKVIAAGVGVLEDGVVSGIPADDFQDWGAAKQIFDDAFARIVLNGNGKVDEAYLTKAAGLLDEIRK
jgi:multiple sugar transport system substrate-binding protein